MMEKKLARRQFIKAAALSVATLPLIQFVLLRSEALAGSAQDTALPTGEKAVLETDPVASAIGYKANVKDIDYAKFPARKAKAAQKDFCKGCALYTPVNAGWGKCQMLTSGVVASAGWCGSYSKKP